MSDEREDGVDDTPLLILVLCSVVMIIAIATLAVSVETRNAILTEQRCHP